MRRNAERQARHLYLRQEQLRQISGPGQARRPGTRNATRWPDMPHL